MNYKVTYDLPTPKEYCDLRDIAGLSKRNLDVAEKSLGRSLFSIIVREQSSSKLVGMGRIIGDWTCLQIVDIAVDPSHQGKKIGRRIMEEVMNFIKKNASENCFVNLFADVDFLYEKFSFVVPTHTTGMKLDWDKFKGQSLKDMTPLP